MDSAKGLNYRSHRERREQRTMKTHCHIIAAVVAAGHILLTVASYAATPDTPETWDSGGIEGWIRHDPLNASTESVSNPTNYLQIVFPNQSTSFPEVHIVRADLSVSGGDFAGNYWNTAITNVSFDLYCGSYLPPHLRLYFYNSTSKNWWYCPLGAPQVGQWTNYDVSLDYSSGWRLGIGGTPLAFKEDRKDVEWIGIQLQRNSSAKEQVYGIDNFVVWGASPSRDSDDDKASDWSEFMAGTDPWDWKSRLQVDIATTNEAVATNGIVLRWTSAPYRTYEIQRSANLKDGFAPIKSGTESTPPGNIYIDNEATGNGPYFYRILVEE